MVSESSILKLFFVSSSLSVTDALLRDILHGVRIATIGDGSGRIDLECPMGISATIYQVVSEKD